MQVVVLLLFLLLSTKQCMLSGKQMGRCVYNPLQKSAFCYEQVNGYVCVPDHNITWSQYNAAYRDSQLQATVLTHLQSQLTLQYEQMTSTLQISNNPACYEAYKKFTCQWNFPFCSSANISQQMCQSVCDAFFLACGGTSDACSIIYAKTDLGLNAKC